jgi:peptide/nickel transport system ATP-binding protein
MSPDTLVIEDLSVSLPAGGDRDHAIRHVSLRIAPGRTLCVVGESGSGKSVMATTVMGLLDKALTPTGGRVVLQGESLLEASPARLRDLRGKAMGMVFQEPMTALNPVMTCGEQVDELLSMHTDWPQAQRRDAILAMFERVKLPRPEKMFDAYPHQLSGGQRQRIVIAMAVILKPALLICDEPTTALDVTTQKEILTLIEELQAEQGSAVMFITHDMGVVDEIADDVLVMKLGDAIEIGSREQVLRQPQAEYTRKLLAAVPGMVPPPPRPDAEGEPILLGQDVAKTYISRDWRGRTHAVDALKPTALALRAGETVGIVGESGSGKSTFARCLIRLIDPTAGRIQWENDDVATLPERQLRRLRHRVQVVFQDPNRSLNPRRTVGDSIVEGAINFGASASEAWALAESLMDKVQLPREALLRYPSQFSGGQRQRIAIARALACKPSVLIADEAVSALDVSVQAQVLKLLREIQDELGVGLLFITHDLRVAAQLCDRVVVMNQGQIVEQGRTHTLYAAPQHEYTQRLFASAPGHDLAGSPT